MTLASTPCPPTLRTGTGERPDTTGGAGTDLFVVVGQIDGRQVRITAATTVAAAAAADFWHTIYPPMTVDWFLGADRPPARPVLLFPHRRPLGPAADQVVHATVLVPGTPVCAHPVTACPAPLRWDQVTVCDPTLGTPCPGCLTQIRRLFQQEPPPTRAAPSPRRTGPARCRAVRALPDPGRSGVTPAPPGRPAPTPRTVPPAALRTGVPGPRCPDCVPGVPAPEIGRSDPPGLGARALARWGRCPGPPPTSRPECPVVRLRGAGRGGAGAAPARPAGAASAGPRRGGAGRTPVAAPRVLVTDARSKRAHLVTEQAFVAGCRAGRAAAVGGDEVLAASLTTPDAGSCRVCAALWWAAR